MSFQAIKSPYSNREYGYLFLGKDPNTAIKITESLVSHGLGCVQSAGIAQPSTELQRLIDLEKQAKQAGIGKFNGDSPSKHVRNVVWYPKNFGDLMIASPTNGIVEHVRNDCNSKLHCCQIFNTFHWRFPAFVFPTFII